MGDFSWTGIDIRQLTHAPGLQNYQNDCFINVVLQFVFHTPQIAKYLWWKINKSNKCQNCTRCVHCILNKYFRRIYSKSPEFEPIEMRQFVNALFPNRVPNKQEDAHEMLTFLLDEIDDPSYFINGQKLWQKSVTDSKKSAIKILFGGRLQSYLFCKKCKKSSGNLEDFQGLNLDLHLEVSKNNRLKDYISEFFKTEFMDNYKCQNCNRKKHTHRKLFLVKQPKLLLIQLKRFRHDGTKISNKIDIPLDLDLKKFLLKRRNVPVEPAEYKLYGYISHSGNSIGNGHFTATMLGYDSNWYLYDDTTIKPTTPNKPARSQPYILFYYKVHVEASKVRLDFETQTETNDEIKGIILSELNNLKSKAEEN